MKRNQTIRNLALFLLLLIAVLVGRNYWPKGQSEAEDLTASWGELKEDTINQIKIEQGSDVVELKKDGDWMVGEYRADGETIKMMLTALLKPTKTEVVSLTNKRHEALGVGDNGVKVKLGDGGSEKVVLMGASADGGRYMRFEGEDKVYLVDNLTTEMTAITVNEWVDKTITRVEEESIRKIAIVYTGQTVNLVRREGEWYQEGSETALDAGGFQPMLNTLESLVTQGLVSEEEEEDYPSQASVSVSVEREGGEPVELNFFEGEEKALVSSSERQGKYVIASTVVENFKLDETDLVAKQVEAATESE